MSTHYNENPYLLLTPGPLSTSPTVRSVMKFDSCTWDTDYKSIVTAIRKNLLTIANGHPDIYTTVLMQGSGTFGVEAVLGSSVNLHHDCLLILANGVYGRRMVEIAKILKLNHVVIEVDENETFSPEEVEKILINHSSITHLAMVHCETTTGILNPIETIAKLAAHYQKHFIVDAMSSFGGIPFDMTALNIDFLISSANKCIQGVPGFSFILCKTKKLIQLCQSNAKSLSLDLFGQWNEMEKDPGKWRYTSPTHTVLAFHQALKELVEEGGIDKRAICYRENQSILTKGMQALGFQPYIKDSLQSPIITTFIEPFVFPGTSKKFIFMEFYQYLKRHGFVIYPGKVAHQNSFRIGSIGHIFADDVKRFLHYVSDFASESMIAET